MHTRCSMRSCEPIYSENCPPLCTLRIEPALQAKSPHLEMALTKIKSEDLLN
jgi:hypothetical protein